MSAAVVADRHAAQVAPDSPRPAVARLAKGATARTVSGHPLMIPATPLRRTPGTDTKAMVARAIEAAGGQTVVARACGVSRQRVAAWADPVEETCLPNLNHIAIAPTSFFRSILADLDEVRSSTEAVLAAIDLDREQRRLVQLVLAAGADWERMSLDGTSATELNHFLTHRLGAIREQGRKLERGLRAALEAREAAEKAGAK